MKRKRENNKKNLPKSKKAKTETMKDRMSKYFIYNHIDCYESEELKEFIRSLKNEDELFEKVIQLYKIKAVFERNVSHFKSIERAEENIFRNLTDDICDFVKIFEENFLGDIFNDKFEECEDCGEKYESSPHFHACKQFQNEKM